jgi:hypothetical protein
LLHGIPTLENLFFPEKLPERGEKFPERGEKTLSGVKRALFTPLMAGLKRPPSV